ncbi:MAG: hypothetical protein S4CHLAM2_16260 [Chlamydiales bacterium]|nr:hypothetical protein [Chlamydiales bacterium]
MLSGVGIQAAQMAVATYAPHVEEVWNLGLAGTLHDQLPIGETVTIEAVGKYIPSGPLDPESQNCVDATVPHFSIDHGTHKLISSDFPIHDLTHRQSLSQQWDLVDMEGYGVAYAAHHLGKKCRMWKIISDFASPGGRALIRKNKAQLSEHLAEIVYESCAHP